MCTFLEIQLEYYGVKITVMCNTMCYNVFINKREIYEQWFCPCQARADHTRRNVASVYGWLLVSIGLVFLVTILYVKCT